MRNGITLVAGLVALALGAPAAPLAAAQVGEGPGGPAIVTLITGDRVRLTASGGAAIEPGPGRAGISFVTERDEGRVRVLPADADALVRTGRLDPRLFDVTTLAESGYADDLALIVTGSGPAALRSAVAAGAARVTREIPALRGLAVRTARQDRARFWKDVALSGGTSKIWLDGLRTPSLDVSVKQIGAPAAWERGLTGAGVKVAVLDTGVDVTHPDLVGRVGAQADFTGGSDVVDRSGHGTHIASTIAGTGAASGGTYRGVAPGATILAGKVCEAVCAESAVLAGLQWAADQGAKVVNLSLGGADTPGLDPLEAAVEALTDTYGMLFVAAAGNSGTERSVESPASTDAALAVGAVTKSGELAEFSSRGPRAGDSGLKPEITAPGADIVAARSKDSPHGEGSYLTMSGTSMSTPHIAGAAAILAGQHPDWSPGTLKAALMGSAAPNPALGIFDQGAGRVDVARATAQAVTAEPAGVSFGVQEWPHEDDEPLTRQVAYRNHGSTPVTLELSADRPFSVQPATVTIPAGGQTEVSVTADTTGAPLGPLGGYLLARGDDGLRVSTPLAVENEKESYALTLRHTGRDGSPTTDFLTTLHRNDASGEPIREIIVQSPTDSTVTLRLPAGRWMIRSTLFDGEHTAQLIHPGLGLTRNQALDLDARLAKPISVSMPDPAAAPVGAEITFTDGLLAYPIFAGRFDNLATAQLGPDQTYDKAVTRVAGTWTKPGAVYRFAWQHQGGMPTGLTRRVATRDLAVIRTAYAAHAGRGRVTAAPPGFHLLTEVEIATPAVLTEYVNADSGLRWRRYFHEEGTEADLESAPSAYQPGHAYRESWNTGVFSPVLPSGSSSVPGEEYGGVTRSGDAVQADVPLFGDGDGHTGRAAVRRARVTLHRDGVLVGDRDTLGGKPFAVPPEAAEYRLVMEAERTAPATLSTRVVTAWTFRSEHTADVSPLPVSVVRFSPALDARNTAPSGRTFPIPIHVDRQPGSAAGELRGLTVEASYDDGVSWQRAQVRAGVATVLHPGADGYVSLRAKAADTAGGTVEQTIIRAYRIESED
ncbi:MAG TPA: S8 family serine peptidase [Nonomuraea sp.]|nr:S8 family serine peptidase [Nonomuraea sp.]